MEVDQQQHSLRCEAPPSYEQSIEDAAPAYPCPHGGNLHGRHNDRHRRSDLRAVKLTLQLRKPGTLSLSQDMSLGDIEQQHSQPVWIDPTTLLRAQTSLLKRARACFGLPAPSPSVQFFVVLILRLDGREVTVNEQNWETVVKHLSVEPERTELVFVLSMVRENQGSASAWQKLKRAFTQP